MDRMEPLILGLPKSITIKSIRKNYNMKNNNIEIKTHTNYNIRNDDNVVISPLFLKS